MSDVHPLPPHMPFLRCDHDPDSAKTFLVIKSYLEEALRVEEAIASVAAMSHDLTGNLKVAVVSHPPVQGNCFSGSEEVGSGILAEALELACGRPFAADDIVFLLDGQQLDWYRAEADDAMYVAIHNLSVLIASTAAPRARDTLYLATCCVILVSLGLNDIKHQRLLEDFLRMWARGKIGEGGDPPTWDADAVAKVRLRDPWAAQFMEGLSGSIHAFDRMALPVPLGDLAEAARALQGRATLTDTETVGRA